MGLSQPSKLGIEMKTVQADGSFSFTLMLLRRFHTALRTRWHNPEQVRTTEGDGKIADLNGVGTWQIKVK